MHFLEGSFLYRFSLPPPAANGRIKPSFPDSSGLLHFLTAVFSSSQEATRSHASWSVYTWLTIKTKSFQDLIVYYLCDHGQNIGIDKENNNCLRCYSRHHYWLENRNATTHGVGGRNFFFPLLLLLSNEYLSSGSPRLYRT